MNPRTFRIVRRFVAHLEGEIRLGVSAVIKELGLELSDREVAILRYLGERRGEDVTVGDIQERLGESPSAVSQAISRLMDTYELVTKDRGRKDQRQTFVRLTTRGLGAASAILRRETELIEEHAVAVEPTEHASEGYKTGELVAEDLATSMFARGLSAIATKKLERLTQGDTRGNIARVYDYLLGGSQYSLTDEAIAMGLIAD